MSALQVNMPKLDQLAAAYQHLFIGGVAGAVGGIVINKIMDIIGTSVFDLLEVSPQDRLRVLEKELLEIALQFVLNSTFIVSLSNQTIFSDFGTSGWTFLTVLLGMQLYRSPAHKDLTDRFSHLVGVVDLFLDDWTGVDHKAKVVAKEDVKN